MVAAPAHALASKARNSSSKLLAANVMPLSCKASSKQSSDNLATCEDEYDLEATVVFVRCTVSEALAIFCALCFSTGDNWDASKRALASLARSSKSRSPEFTAIFCSCNCSWRSRRFKRTICEAFSFLGGMRPLKNKSLRRALLYLHSRVRKETTYTKQPGEYQANLTPSNAFMFTAHLDIAMHSPKLSSAVL